MLYDKNFLLELDKQKNKNTYAKITSLTFDEFPIESIEGRISQGSINIDGNSALRRTCQLIILLDSYDYNNYDWSLHTKFKLEIGVENTVNQNYPEIIWFNQGIYLITSFSTSKTINNFTLSISGKDKMCLLNGDIGGIIEAETDFGQLEEAIEETYVLRKIPIKEIINNLVSIYGKELKHNIIINDLDMPGLELLEYRYDTPMYLYKRKNDNGYQNIIIENDDYEVYVLENNNYSLKKLKDLDNSYFNLLINGLNGVSVPDNLIYLKGEEEEEEEFVQYNFAKISYGQQAGYRETDLVYPGDLIANPGDSIVSVLDKIKNMFTEFEYFYDLDGRFVFQQKKSSLKTLWSKKNPDSPIKLDKNLTNQNIDYYLFDNSELLISLNNTPDLSKIKNDFSIWGERESISGAKIPIHIRYAIDKKPQQYTSISVNDNPNDLNNDCKIIESYNKKYNTNLTGQTPKTYIRNNSYNKINGNEIQCDWREIIYQMACDYYKYNFLPDFEDRVFRNNPTFIGGKTGYENYYTDIFGFWRDIYDPEIDNKIETYRGNGKTGDGSVASKIIGSLTGCKIAIMNLEKENQTIETNLENETDEYKIKDLWGTYKENQLNIFKEKEKVKVWKDQGKKIIGWPVLTEKYFEIISDLQSKFKAFFTKQEIEKLDSELKEDPGLIRELQEKEFLFYKKESERGWLKDVFLCPENLVFWFDFLDTSGEISKNSVKNIGQRLTAVKDSQITSIYNRDTPDILFVEEIPKTPLNGYTYIKISNIEEMFSVSAQGISAYNKLEEKLNEHSSFVETISITALPIYYFEPGMIVQITDKDTNSFGEYIVNKISFNLSYNGTMQLNGNKIIQDIVA